MGRWTAKNPDGHERYFKPGGATTREHDLLRCKHCGVFWYVKPGSGAKRGWCTYCGGPHCGGPKCWECSLLKRKVEERASSDRFAAAAGLQKK
jgi:hypothetical protein